MEFDFQSKLDFFGMFEIIFFWKNLDCRSAVCMHIFVCSIPKAWIFFLILMKLKFGNLPTLILHFFQ